MECQNQFAFFSICARQTYGYAEPPKLRERAVSIADRLNLLYQFASDTGIRILSTQCIGGRPPAFGNDAASANQVLRCDPSLPNKAESLFSTASEVLIERPSFGSPDENRQRHAPDPFHSNPNTESLVRELQVQEWIVFGVSLQACVTYAVDGLLRCDQNVTLLTDTVLPAAGPTETSVEQSLESMRNKGVTLESCAAFLRRAKARGANL